MKIIGINGYKGAGKDTVALAIREAMKRNNPHAKVKRRALADNLKVMAMLALGYEGQRPELLTQANTLKQDGYVDSCLAAGVGTHLDGRQYIINFGQYAREQFGEDFWVDQVLPLDGWKLNEIWRGHTHLPAIGCVTDIRMPNEALRVRNLGGTIINVSRPGYESDGQATEQPLPDDLINYALLNDSGVLALYSVVEDLCEELGLFGGHA